MWTPWTNKYLKKVVLNLIIPPRCANCGKYLDIFYNKPLCSTCKGAIHSIAPPLCLVCGIPFRSPKGPNRICGNCIKNPPPWDSLRSLFLYSDTIKSLIHAFKFNGKCQALRGLQYLAQDSFKNLNLEADIVCPMPLSSKKLRQRGFNQCLELIRGINAIQQDKIDPLCLKKIKDTPAQSELSRKDRLKNVKGVFWADPKRIKGKSVLLFDDVLTTGATSKEATLALRKAGAASVHVVTYARTLSKV